MIEEKNSMLPLIMGLSVHVSTNTAILLKSSGVIDWHWIWVLSPFWATCGYMLCMIMVWWIEERIFERKMRKESAKYSEE